MEVQEEIPAPQPAPGDPCPELLCGSAVLFSSTDGGREQKPMLASAVAHGRVASMPTTALKM